ncbi:ATP synthase subunit C [Sansalvadorimonas sp. 2012CJ34-2]|uniref:ATP synthase subunit C n=1 Tax=Parendozoicomonas callyspongiae TaxID=2942213 RepID=A0ABT0PK05_9GAMM|nr:ATP synthase subunit C [Sansalvadorimonas sp. 2012CJ34-2]MCL6271042.1 ATP synthase subunit C [Sansalvadorimonas sp. 2012CJ34-2]
MEQLIIALGWVGVFAPVALGAVGSAIGCSVAGQAACGAMLDVESGYGKFVGVSAMPSSQVIYGIVIMFTLSALGVSEATSAGLFGIGLLTGVALMYSAIYQGQAVAASINASKNKPEVFGLSIAPAAIVEGFAVFAFVFALVLGQAIV